jgi:hypothetical protein
MNRRLLGTFGVVAALVGTLAGCKKDPLSDLDGTPVAIVKQFSQLHIPVDSVRRLTASVVDGRFTPLELPVTFTARAATITVTIDTAYHPVPATSSGVVIKAVSAGNTWIDVQGAGLRDSVRILVP